MSYNAKGEAGIYFRKRIKVSLIGLFYLFVLLNHVLKLKNMKLLIRSGIIR